jgi:hypothetical protein
MSSLSGGIRPVADFNFASPGAALVCTLDQDSATQALAFGVHRTDRAAACCGRAAISPRAPPSWVRTPPSPSSSIPRSIRREFQRRSAQQTSKPPSAPPPTKAFRSSSLSGSRNEKPAAPARLPGPVRAYRWLPPGTKELSESQSAFFRGCRVVMGRIRNSTNFTAFPQPRRRPTTHEKQP